MIKIMQIDNCFTPLDCEFDCVPERKEESLGTKAQTAYRKWKDHSFLARLRKTRLKAKTKKRRRKRAAEFLDGLAYAEYLGSSRWHTLQRKCLRKAKRVCQRCGGRATHAHHHIYPSKWSEDSLDNLVAVCGGCRS